ncbi:MAG: TetR/AcrR family transcriptional regulator [Actinomycetota bacterium]
MSVDGGSLAGRRTEDEQEGRYEVATDSNLEQYRAAREDQSSSRRTNLIDTAETLFLAEGIADTTMMDIAAAAGVSRVTVYRYFSERDHIAFEVAGRMLERLAAASRANLDDDMTVVEASRAGLVGFISSFEEMRDVHRFLAMFDNLGPFRESTEELDRWYRDRSLRAFAKNQDMVVTEWFDADTVSRIVTLTNMILGVLARFSMRTESIEKEQGVALATQLAHLEDMVTGYFDAVVAPNARAKKRRATRSASA